MIESTVVLYFCAIEYKLSPDFTIYVSDVVVSCSCVGIFNNWPMLRMLDDKLLASFNSFTVTPNFLAMLQRLSPLWTV